LTVPPLAALYRIGAVAQQIDNRLMDLHAIRQDLGNPSAILVLSTTSPVTSRAPSQHLIQYRPQRDRVTGLMGS